MSFTKHNPPALGGYGPAIVLVCGLISAAVITTWFLQRPTAEPPQVLVQQAAHRLSQSEVIGEINRSFRDVAARMRPSVVHISASHDLNNPRVARISTGSGWVWDEQGHIITNLHVIHAADQIDVLFHDGSRKPAEIAGFDETTDIAVLKVDDGAFIPAIRSEQSPAQGDIVFAFGSPFDYRFSMSQGIISGLGRTAGLLGRGGYENFIQVDAAINPGNSGGPLTNWSGEVIGMNTAIASREVQVAERGWFAGVGLAIPMDMILPVVEQLIRNGDVQKGFMGVYIAPVDERCDVLFESANVVAHGVLVTGAPPNAPAGRAGVRSGDIILAIDDHSTATMSQLRSIISSRHPGSTVTVRLLRWNADGEVAEQLEILVTLDNLYVDV
ncbi:MAG: trypsin-like peptidase domain-containing protein [Phycisphaerales bacterium]|nr:trypsin-like peptidase domain-containing protein [Phycisphaerales bacterium]